MRCVSMSLHLIELRTMYRYIQFEIPLTIIQEERQQNLFKKTTTKVHVHRS